MLGSYRYTRIKTAVDNGEPGPPVDMRYIRLNLNKEPAATSECISFLEGIYQSIAETLPEIRDCSISTSLVDSTALLETEDSYSKGVTLKKKSVTQVINKKFVKRKGPRKIKSGMQVNRDRSREIRYLPPGRMKDYYEMMLSQYSSETAAPASFATFYRAPGLGMKSRNLEPSFIWDYFLYVDGAHLYSSKLLIMFHFIEMRGMDQRIPPPRVQNKAATFGMLSMSKAPFIAEIILPQFVGQA